MQMPHHDRMSSHRQGWRFTVRLAAITAAAFALVAASVSAAPFSATETPAPTAPSASTAATTCTAKIVKNGKLVDVYERYYKYAYKRIGHSKKYRKTIVRARRKLRVTCARQCVRTKVKRQKKYHYRTVTKRINGKKVKVRVKKGKPYYVKVRLPVYKTVKKKVTVKKGNRLVKVRKKVRVNVFEKCKVTTSSSSGTPVKITILDGSAATLDFGAFIRTASLSGGLSGFIPGGYKLNQDNQITLSRGTINLGVTDVFIDDDCGGQVSAAIRTNAASVVTLDPTRQSTSTVLASGGVTATAYTKIKVALDLRNDDGGCNQPYISTGWQEFAKTFFVKGKIEKGTGLNKLTLTSAPDPLDVEACLSPGPATSPCNGFAIPLPIIVSVKLITNVQIG
jgi:hypothetical protein